jgi:hypothetical protein
VIAARREGRQQAIEERPPSADAFTVRARRRIRRALGS